MCSTYVFKVHDFDSRKKITYDSRYNETKTNGCLLDKSEHKFFSKVKVTS